MRSSSICTHDYRWNSAGALHACVGSCTSFSLLDYENENRSFHLFGVDIIGNGLLTLTLSITKIAVRKRKVLQKNQGLAVHCVMYRCPLQLVSIQHANPTKTHISRGNVRHRGVGANRKKVIIQKMRFVKSPHVFNASHAVFPLQIPSGVYSAWYLLALWDSSSRAQFF